jgi:hypothetical protein
MAQKNQSFFVLGLDSSAPSYINKIEGRKLESQEIFYSSDLICEGPIEGLVDKNGNLLKYIPVDQASDIILGRGVYYNDVPIIDPGVNKFNFVTAGFKINYGGGANSKTQDYPSTIHRYNQKIFLNEAAYTIYYSQNAWNYYYHTRENDILNGFYCIKKENGSFSTVLIGGDNSANEALLEELWNPGDFGGLSVLVARLNNARKTCNPVSHRIKNKYCDYIKIQLSFPQLFSTDSSGNVGHTNLTFVIEFSKSRSSDAFYAICSLTGISKSSFVLNVPFNLSLDFLSDESYYVKIYPLTSKLAITEGNRFKEFMLSSVVEKVSGKGVFNYPNSVIVQSGISSRHFSQDPNRTFDLKLLKIKVPNNYDSEAREYRGNWNGKFDSFLRWTDNPAWIFYDICTNSRYGVGNGLINDTDLNKWELYKIAKYCDSLVRVDAPQKYEEDIFYTQPGSNELKFIYIEKSSEDKAPRTLAQMKEQYPPINFNSSNAHSRNGGTNNSIIYLYDISYTDSNGILEKVETVYKKIIYDVTEVAVGANGFFAQTPEGEGTAYRISLMDDFGPRRYFEQEPTGEMLENFKNRYVKLGIDGDDAVAESLSTAIQDSVNNTEDTAKRSILGWMLSNYKNSYFAQSRIDRGVLPLEYKNIAIYGKCLPKSLGYKEPFEPRFSANILIDNEVECLRLLNDLSSVFRGITYYKNNLITATIDVDKPVSYVFNNTNIKDGNFSYSSGSIDGNYSVAKILFKDKDDNFNDNVEIVEDSEMIKKYGIVVKEILGFGVTSRDQARRIGTWLLATNRFENQSVSFVTDMQAISLKPSDVIRIEDSNKNNSTLQGRVLSVSPDSGYVVVDRKINLNLTGKKIKFITSKTEKKYSDIQDSSDLDSSEPVGFIEFFIDRIENNSGRIYLSATETLDSINAIIATSIFVIDGFDYSGSDNLYKIVSISEQDINEYSIFCIRHEPNKYLSIDKDLIFDFKTKDDYAISYSIADNLSEFDLTGMGESYYGLEYVSLSEVFSDDVDYAFSDDGYSSEYSSQEDNVILNLFFNEIYFYIIRESGSSEYYRNARSVLESGGGFLCKLTFQNQSIKFKVQYNNISTKRVFLGKSTGGLKISSVSGIKIYLYNSQNQIVEL